MTKSIVNEQFRMKIKLNPSHPFLAFKKASFLSAPQLCIWGWESTCSSTKVLEETPGNPLLKVCPASNGVHLPIWVLLKQSCKRLLKPGYCKYTSEIKKTCFHNVPSIFNIVSAEEILTYILIFQIIQVEHCAVLSIYSYSFLRADLKFLNLAFQKEYQKCSGFYFPIFWPALDFMNKVQTLPGMCSLVYV